MTTATPSASNPAATSTSASASPVRAPRVWFVDILRLIASFQMVNGHTIDAVMVTTIRHGAFYDRYIWFRGLVSVTFLAVAGIAFYLSTLCRFEKHRSSPGAVRRRFRRAVVIIVVGYLLGFPWGIFNGDPEVRRLTMERFGTVDVLHCIGAALLLLELITVLARNARQVLIASGLVAMGLFFGAPLADGTLVAGERDLLRNWISHQGGSAFPLFPWAGYVFAGVVIGAWILPQAGATPFGKTLRRLLGATAVVAAAGWLIGSVLPSLHEVGLHHPSTDPELTFDKLAVLLGFVVILALVCRPLRNLPRLFRVLSSETLVIYTFHLVVLFYPGLSLGKRFAHELQLPAALGMSLFMLLFTGAFTWVWHHFWARRRAQGS